MRYLPPNDKTGVARYGEPVIKADEDVGVLASRGALNVKVLEGSGIFDLTGTERIESVGKLLGPLTEADVPIIRCIGLNYTTHSK